MMSRNFFTVRIAAVETAARDVVTLTLEAEAGGALPAWAPGAHVDLHLPSGRVRKYSLMSDPADRSAWRLAVLRQPGGKGGSVEIHAALAAGTCLPVAGPFNHFPMIEAPAYLFLAGGIGVTPFLPMIARARAEGRPWRLLYVGRDRTGMVALPELARHGAQVTLAPTAETGRPDLKAVIAATAPGTAIYCCGPEAMMAGAAAAAAALGRSDDLHMERFGPASRDPAAAPLPAGAFEAEIASTGEVMVIGAAESLGDRLLAAGHACTVSCGEGYCGSCLLRVLDGQIDHRDDYLTEAERAEGQMMPCVSRARSARLLLDL